MQYDSCLKAIEQSVIFLSVLHLNKYTIHFIDALCCLSFTRSQRFLLL